MISVTGTFAELPNYGADSAITLAMRLARAEDALHALTAGQVDAIVDPSGKTYLLCTAQEHLRHNESRLLDLIESIADVIIVVNRGGTITSQNMAATRILSYGPQELLGKNLFEFVHYEDQATLYSAFFNVIEGILKDDTVQFRHRTGDGSFRIVEATIGKLSEPSLSSVVLSLRPVTGSRLESTEPAWQPRVLDASEFTTKGPAAHKPGDLDVKD